MQNAEHLNNNRITKPVQLSQQPSADLFGTEREREKEKEKEKEKEHSETIKGPPPGGA